MRVYITFGELLSEISIPAASATVKELCHPGLRHRFLISYILEKFFIFIEILKNFENSKPTVFNIMQDLRKFFTGH